MRQRCCDCAFCFKFAGSADCNYGNVYAPIKIRNPKIKSMYHYNSCPKYKKRSYTAGAKMSSKNWYSVKALNKLWELEVKYEKSNKDL